LTVVSGFSSAFGPVDHNHCIR